MEIASRRAVLFFAVLVLYPSLFAGAQDFVALDLSQKFKSIPDIAKNYCAACHDWAQKPSSLMSRVVPGKPEESLFFSMMESGEMPMSDTKPSTDEILLVREWILAGAPLPGQASAPLPGGNGDAVNAASGSLPAMPKPSKIEVHKVLGFTSSGLLLAAGAVGVWRFVDAMEKGHAYRDSIGFPEEGGNEALRIAEIKAAWADPAGQALRWTHIGLLAAGGTLYMINAFTGTSMFSPEDAGLSKRDVHRYAFFLHAGLMTTEAVLGFIMTDALRRGDHGLVSELGPVHLALGFSIPLIMAGSGLVVTLRF